MILNKNKYNELIKSYKNYEILNKDKSITKLTLKINNNNNALIWIHGYNDYYYNLYIGEKFIKKGFDIYAVKLRRYQQNNHNKIFYCDNLNEYIQDIDNIFPKILEKKYNKIILYGHSMGGLVSSIYCKDGKYKDKITHLVLNSPFFDFKVSFFEKILLYYIIYYLGYFFPNLIIRSIDLNTENYLTKNIKKRFYINNKYKLDVLSPVYASWIKTIIDYQNRIKYKNLSLNIPILVLFCTKSTIFTNSDQTGDDTLEVDHIDKYSNNLGSNIKKYKFENAIHDIFSSSLNTINDAFEITLNWINLI